MESVIHRYVYGLDESSIITGLPKDSLAEHLTVITIPGNHKRVLQKTLQEYLKLHNIAAPLSWSEPMQRLRVLVVEDDDDLLELVTELLHDEERIDVRGENNAFNAGLQVAGWQPDLILLDFLMPGMNGFDLCRHLRKGGKTADIAVLAMTGLTADENRAQVMASGVSDFIGKPFHSEDLLGKVREMLALSSAADASAKGQSHS